LNVQPPEPAVPVAPFVAEQPATTPFQPEPAVPARQRRKKAAKEPENTLGGLDTNLGSAFEPNLRQPLARTISLQSEEAESKKKAGRPRTYFSEDERRAARAERRAYKVALGQAQAQVSEEPLSPREAYESSISFIGEPKAPEAPPGIERKRGK
jgi:hypothetical protein